MALFWPRALCGSVCALWLTPCPQARTKKLGIEAFDAHEDPFEPGTFHWWERYTSADALRSYCSSAGQQAFEEGLLPLLEGGIGMLLYEWADGKLGSPSIPIGPKGEGGLDDATGQSGGAGGGAGYTQTSGAVDLGKVRRGDEGDSFGLKGKAAMVAAAEH